MRKIFISLVAVLACAISAMAQSTMLATLNHEGTISTFYGTNALRDAHVAADHGDVITLSSGTFVSTDITKGITIRGAGMEVNPATQSEPTIISGDFNISIDEDVENRLTIEGIYSNSIVYYSTTVLKNAMFLKCRLKNIVYSNTGKLKDANFIHCRIANRISLNKESSALCINSVVADPFCSDYSALFEFTNCVIYSDGLGRIYGSLKNSIISNNVSGDFSERSSVYNCIYIGPNLNPFKHLTNSTNVAVLDHAKIYETYRGETFEKLDSETFELTDEAKTKYLGIDGSTEVGIYGGNLPFDATPSNPQITKCNVAAKSTADGKLSVDIQISSAK